MKFAKRMDVFGESIFTTLAKMRQERASKGLEVIDLSIGAPNIKPDPRIVNKLTEETNNRDNYMYAITDLPELQEAVQSWYKRRYGVDIDPRTEVTSMLGSQEGLSHLALILIDEGDTVLIPDPCYPIFRDGPLLAGAKVVGMPLLKENDYVIDLDSIDDKVADEAKLMVVSYPNNPTCGVAPASFYRDLIKFAKKHDIVVLHDNAYSELSFEQDGHSFLEYEGAKDVGIEFNSLSKTYAIAGARCGFMIGNSEIVAKYKILKSNMDYGMFLPIQRAAIEAIMGDQEVVSKTREAYRHRRDLFVNGCREIGWDIDLPKGSMFVWAKIPDKFKDSESFTYELFDKTGVLVVPGKAFGDHGEGFVRIALVQDDDVMRHAFKLMDESGLFRE